MSSGRNRTGMGQQTVQLYHRVASDIADFAQSLDHHESSDRHHHHDHHAETIWLNPDATNGLRFHMTQRPTTFINLHVPTMLFAPSTKRRTTRRPT